MICSNGKIFGTGTNLGKCDVHIDDGKKTSGGGNCKDVTRP